MDDENHLNYGEPQDASVELRRETFPGQLNVTFTRGFVSSQASCPHRRLSITMRNLAPSPR